MSDDELAGELVNLGFLLDAASATPEAFDLETVLGRARRAVAALDAVLKLADDWYAKAQELDEAIDAGGLPAPRHTMMMASAQANAAHSGELRKAIRRELPYGSPHE